MKIKSKKICAVITARPSYSRIKTALLALKEYKNIKLNIVLSGSACSDKYGSIIKTIKDDGLKITEIANNTFENNNLTTMSKSTGMAVIDLAKIFERMKPDMVLTIADRYETIATSIAASYQNIFLVHIQGGENTGSIDDKTRNANMMLSDMHLVSNNDAKRQVLKRVKNKKMVFNTGCPSIDLAREVLSKPKLKFNPISKYGGVGNNIQWKNGYIVFLQHSVTTEFESSIDHFKNSIDAVREINYPTFCFWPNIDAGSDEISKIIRRYREKNLVKNFHFFKNMEPKDFLYLLKNSRCLVGNSSVGIRECSFLGVPVVNIGNRQKNRKKGSNVINTVNNKDKIKKSIQTQLMKKNLKKDMIYGNGFSGKKIAKILSQTLFNYN